MANITRWDPLQEMLTLREAMSQLMEESYVRPDAARGQGFVERMVQLRPRLIWPGTQLVVSRVENPQ